MPIPKIVRLILSTDCHNIFNSNIYYRGIEYYEQDQVDKVEISENEVKAVVYGTKVYKTSISCHGDKLNFYCSCPYEYRCKHEVALFLFISKRYEQTTETVEIKENNDIFTRIMSINQNIVDRIGSYRIVNEKNNSVITNLAKLNLNLIYDNVKTNDEKIFLAFFNFIDIIYTLDIENPNPSTDVMYNNVDSTLIKIISENNTLSAFEHYLLTCKLPQIVKEFIRIYNNGLIGLADMYSSNLIDVYMALFQYLSRGEVNYFDKNKDLDDLTECILSLLKKQRTLDRYNEFVETYKKINLIVYFDYLDNLYTTGNYQTISQIKNTEEYLFVNILIIASYEHLGKKTEADQLLSKCYVNGLKLIHYEWFKKYISKALLRKHHHRILETCLNYNQYDTYMQICIDEEYYEEAFKICIEQPFDFFYRYVKVFIGLYDQEILIKYQNIVYKKITAPRVVNSELIEITKILNMMLLMKNGQYYVYGVIKASYNYGTSTRVQYELRSIYNMLRL